MHELLTTYPPAYFKNKNITSPEDFIDYLEEYDVDAVEVFMQQYGKIYASNPCFKEKEYFEYSVLKDSKFQYVFNFDDFLKDS